MTGSLIGSKARRLSETMLFVLVFQTPQIAARLSVVCSSFFFKFNTDTETGAKLWIGLRRPLKSSYPQPVVLGHKLASSLSSFKVSGAVGNVQQQAPMARRITGVGFPSCWYHGTGAAPGMTPWWSRIELEFSLNRFRSSRICDWKWTHWTVRCWFPYAKPSSWWVGLQILYFSAN